MLELGEYPLIAMGRMQWLANRHGETTESLTKPSPVQMLAALGAAVSGEEGSALEAAYALVRNRELCPPLVDLAHQPFRVFVLEDATLGLQAAANGQHILEECGLRLEKYGIGVTDSPVKSAALAPYCDTIVPNVNAGLAWVEAQARGSPLTRVRSQGTIIKE
jgi:hypothetical protein